MADYKRFVSYMYEYENGTKKRNVGYARVEIRNGECRFTIHMQLKGLLEGIFPTYLIYRPKDEMDLVYLGDCTVRNQVMDSRLTAKENNIMDSGHRFSDMGGILLFLNSGVFYATQWDDKPVVLEEVLDALKPKTKSKPQEAIPTLKVDKPEDTKIISDEPDSMEEEINEKLKVAKILEPDKKPVNESTKTFGKELSTNRPVYMLPGGYKTKESISTTRPKTPINPWELVERYKESVANSKESMELLSKGIKPVDIKLKEDVHENTTAKDIEKDTTPKLSVDKDIVQNDVSPQDTKVKDMDKVKSHTEGFTYNKHRNGKIKADRSRNNRFVREEKQKENPLATKIFATYPRIYPFEDNEITRCVKIEPKDIGELPSDTWILSNNSFLLHGYYCYHHLIFAEIVDGYGCRYIIGIPGIYHNRERFMARMFGFECFKSIRKRELKQGDFGYWYVEVEI